MFVLYDFPDMPLTQHELSAVFVLHSSQEEQTYPTGSHVQMPTPVKYTQTSIKANQLDTPAAAGLSVEPPVDSLSPSRMHTDTVLPKSCKTICACVSPCCVAFSC